MIISNKSAWHIDLNRTKNVTTVNHIIKDFIKIIKNKNDYDKNLNWES